MKRRSPRRPMVLGRREVGFKALQCTRLLVNVDLAYQEVDGHPLRAKPPCLAGGPTRGVLIWFEPVASQPFADLVVPLLVQNGQGKPQVQVPRAHMRFDVPR